MSTENDQQLSCPCIDPVLEDLGVKPTYEAKERFYKKCISNAEKQMEGLTGPQRAFWEFQKGYWEYSLYRLNLTKEPPKLKK